jgi:hypothetical protein
MLAGSVSCGIAVQVLTQCRADEAAGLVVPVVPPSVDPGPRTSATIADEVTTRARVRTMVVIRWVSGILLDDFTGTGTAPPPERVRFRAPWWPETYLRPPGRDVTVHQLMPQGVPLREKAAGAALLPV